jgi:hypothetical protein
MRILLKYVLLFLLLLSGSSVLYSQVSELPKGAIRVP